eukprot:scaffold5132_cov112-Isochrysis_galbana.AAC.2
MCGVPNADEALPSIPSPASACATAPPVTVAQGHETTWPVPVARVRMLRPGTAQGPSHFPSCGRGTSTHVHAPASNSSNQHTHSHHATAALALPSRFSPTDLPVRPPVSSRPAFHPRPRAACPPRQLPTAVRCLPPPHPRRLEVGLSRIAYNS